MRTKDGDEQRTQGLKGEGYTTPWGQNVLVQRKSGLKRLSLRFSQKQAIFLVSVPLRYPVKEIRQFIDGAKAWFTKVLTQQQITQPTATKAIEPGQIIQLLGKPVTLKFIEGCRAKVVLNDDVLAVHGIRSRFEQQVRQYFQELAQAKFSEYSNCYAKKLGVTIAKIKVKEMTSRYGSCTSIGNLNYCWRIVFSPEPVLAYLCAHEVAHLREMNHSQAFWTHVATLCPEYVTLRKWLKQHGKELFAVG